MSYPDLFVDDVVDFLRSSKVSDAFFKAYCQHVYDSHQIPSNDDMSVFVGDCDTCVSFFLGG